MIQQSRLRQKEGTGTDRDDAGAQKVVPDLETALRRIRSYSLPREHLRLQEFGQSSFIGKVLIVEREALPERATVVLVREPIGF